MVWINTILQGVMLGGLYGLFAMGLSLIFGVMRLLNIAHGDFIILSAYLGLIVSQLLGLHPLIAPLVVVPLMALLGYWLQRSLLNRTVGKNLLAPLLVTFGFSIISQNLLLEIFTADNQMLSTGSLGTASVNLTPDISVGVLPLANFVTAFLVLGSLQVLFYRTSLGRTLRATSDDAEVASLMGIDVKHVYAIAMAISFAVIAIAGALVSVRTTFDPTSGPTRLLYAFEAVIIGGLGNLWATLLGGVVLGIAQTVGAQINPNWQTLSGHLVFLLVLMLRPKGFFPKVGR